MKHCCTCRRLDFLSLLLVLLLITTHNVIVVTTAFITTTTTTTTISRSNFNLLVHQNDIKKSKIIRPLNYFDTYSKCQKQQKQHLQLLFAIKNNKKFISEYSIQDDDDDVNEQKNNREIQDDNKPSEIVGTANTASSNNNILQNENKEEQEQDGIVDENTLQMQTTNQEQQQEEVVLVEKKYSNINNNSNKYQYGAMGIGTIIQTIQIGDISLGRKAWKKRRRSGSPLLIPCSILNVDCTSTIKYNILYLLQKFGRTSSNNNTNSGIRISIPTLIKKYNSYLKSSIEEYAAQYGYDNVNTFLQEHLFPKQVQDSFGITLYNDNEDNTLLWLEAPYISQYRAQKRIKKTPLLQFHNNNNNNNEDNNEDNNNNILQHTGWVRIQHTKDEMKSGKYKYPFRNSPLSAALRVTKEYLEANDDSIYNGSTHTAMVLDYDIHGDAGSPLLTLTLDPSINNIREQIKFIPSNNKINNNYYNANVVHHEPKIWFNNLQMGQKITDCTIVRLVKGGALVDCGVGRYKSNHNNNEEEATTDISLAIPVLGRLRFKDAILNPNDENSNKKSIKNKIQSEGRQQHIENNNNNDDDFFTNLKFDDYEVDEDESEDITHLFNYDDKDGSLTYTDPETGEKKIVYDSTEIDDDDNDDENDDDITYNKSTNVKTTRDSMDNNTNNNYNKKPSYKTVTLKVGDVIDNVYVKTIYKQSNQFAITMDSSIQGRKAKDIKKENDTNKKMKRLLKQIGGYQRLQELSGIECNGIIKATSNVDDGNIYYVLPNVDGLPIGVATIASANNNNNDDIITNSSSIDDDDIHYLRQGDSVRIRLTGIDQQRGQLAMHILEKLEP